MTPKQLAVLGVAVAATSKFYFGNETKTAAILGLVAVVAAALSDNIFPATAVPVAE